jgi:hypothetical protein
MPYPSLAGRRVPRNQSGVTPPPTSGAQSTVVLSGDFPTTAGGSVDNLIASTWYNDSTVDCLCTIGDNVYPGDDPTDWSTFALNPYVLRGGSTAADQWLFPTTGHHDWGKVGATGAEMIGPVASPADGLKPYMDSKATGLQYGDGLWYYRHDLTATGWAVIHLSGTTRKGSTGPAGSAIDQPLVPNGGGFPTTKALTANVATLGGLGTGHGIRVGQTVTVALSPADATFDGTHTVTAVGTNSVSWSQTHANVASVATAGSVGVAQWVWLETQLKDVVAKGWSALCIWSDPRWATDDNKHVAEPTMQPFWDALGAYLPNDAIVVNCHKHNYERFFRMTPGGAVDTANGIPQFVVGTGGESHYLFQGTAATGSAVRNDTDYGALELTLRSKAADFRFLNTAGTVLDSGSYTFTTPTGGGGGGGGGGANLLSEDLNGVSGTTAGTAVSTANSSMSAVFGTAPTFDATAYEGAFAARFNTTAATGYLRKDITSSGTVWIQMAIRLTALPAAATFITSWLQGTTKIGDLRVNTDGTLSVRDNNTAVITSTSALSAGSYAIVSVKCTPGGASGHTLKVYLTPTSGTPSFTGTGAATAAAATAVDTLRFGVIAAATIDYRLDRLRADSATEPAH